VRSHEPSHRPAASPLAPALAFTALSSFAAGSATLSVFFVTARAPYEFSPVQQYALGLLVGLTYMTGALLAGDVRRRLAARGIAARTMLAWLALAMAGLMVVPTFVHSDASVYALLALYAPLTGLFWPLVEGYVSGGRRAGELRGAIGRFNIVWSVTLLPSFLLPPLIEDRPALVFLAVAATHLASVLCLRGFRAEPGEHADESHAVPRDYPELLRVHRVLHATSYLVMYALSPYLPTLLARLGVDGRWRGALAATWLAARTVTFAVLERWHGWHGRWSVASVGTLLVLAGFAATVLAPRLGAAGLATALVALVAFGTGLAALYTAALYYAFEVGGNEGGGSHEALIGLGYSIGPSCGLVVCALEHAGALGEAERDGALLVVITTLCLFGAVLAWRRRRTPT
jgi:hypothetical protein